jgi:hypothetical protein
MYLRDKTGKPLGCVAISRSKNGKQVRYQVSVANPVDKFERDLARHIAYGRLLEKPVRINGFVTESTQFDVNWAIMYNIATNKSLPSRARKAAQLWLNRNSVQ